MQHGRSRRPRSAAVPKLQNLQSTVASALLSGEAQRAELHTEPRCRERSVSFASHLGLGRPRSPSAGAGHPAASLTLRSARLERASRLQYVPPSDLRAGTPRALSARGADPSAGSSLRRLSVRVLCAGTAVENEPATGPHGDAPPSALPRAPPADWADCARQMAHPVFAALKDPQFLFGDVGAERSLSAKPVEHSAEMVWRLAQEYASLLRENWAALPAEGSTEQILEALSIAFHYIGPQAKLGARLSFSLGLDGVYKREVSKTILEKWQSWSKLASVGQPVGQRCLEPLDGAGAGDRSWITTGISELHHMRRLSWACCHLRSIATVPGVADLVAGTRLLSWVSDGKPLRSQPQPVNVTMSRQPTLEVAMFLAPSQRTAIVLVASSSVVGGGFLAGVPHRLEEEACARSTLFASLREAERKARLEALQDSSGRPVHVPEDGAVLSPGVDFFRHGPKQGYAALPVLVKLVAVLSVSMPNIGNPQSEEPVSTMSPPFYHRLVQQKLMMAMLGASCVGAEVLVVSDLGCVDRGYEPALLGRLIGHVILEAAQTPLREVVLTGNVEFQKAARNVWLRSRRCRDGTPGFLRF